MLNFSLEFKGCLPDKNLSVLAFLAFLLPAAASINHLTRCKKFISDTPPNVGTLHVATESLSGSHDMVLVRRHL